MGKVKKIIIHEEGRILSPEELNASKGGCDVYQSCQTGYGHCNQLTYNSCTIAISLTGYVYKDGETYCGSGYTYYICTTGATALGTCLEGLIYSTS